MAATTRRHLLKTAAFGGVSATGLAMLSSHGVTAAEGQKPDSGSDHAHDNRPLTDKRAMTSVSFGQWDVSPAPTAPLDRMVASPPNRNVHLHLPFEAEVDAGGAVSFIISGLHQVVIYDDGNTYESIRAAALAAPPVPAIPAAGAVPELPPLINYAVGRLYRGLDPRILFYSPGGSIGLLVADRVESVNFKDPGRYLVVCGVLPHFSTGMYGYVNVKA